MRSPSQLAKIALDLGMVLAVSMWLAEAPSFAADPSLILDTSRWEISAEGTVAHFGPRLNERGIQAWNISGRVSIVPFGVTHFHLMKGVFDGALEIGLEPTFERFSVLHPHPTARFGPTARFDIQYHTQPIFNRYPALSSIGDFQNNSAGFANYEGAGLVLRYYFVHFQYGPIVPWIEAGIAPGGTDLKIGEESNETRLNGPFMNRIKGGVGVDFFVNENVAAYAGLQAQHISNAGLNGPNQNYALNTPVSFAVGASWFFH
jgi:Lipid A 3-O-deacylase (PagL)